jgi:signal peptidase I
MILIKRVIGMPGDRIVIDGNQVSVNGKALTVSQKTTSGGRIEIIERGSAGDYRTIWRKTMKGRKEFKVPKGEVFVMGDNRNRSRDSRFIGSIPLTNVFAVPRQIFLSFDRQWNVRWDRIGKPIT